MSTVSAVELTTAAQTAFSPSPLALEDAIGSWVVRETAGPNAPPPKLLDRVRDELRLRHYSHRTEQAYLSRIRRFVLFHGKRHPTSMGEVKVTHFLSHLAKERRVSASTQNQALGALLFLYGVVLGRELPWLDNLVRAKRPARLPVVLTRQEVVAILDKLQGVSRLMALLLYGAGLRLLECARLRVKDVDSPVQEAYWARLLVPQWLASLQPDLQAFQGIANLGAVSNWRLPFAPHQLERS